MQQFRQPQKNVIGIEPADHEGSVDVFDEAGVTAK
jgi:hypothetical protein